MGESKPSGNADHVQKFARQGNLPFGKTGWDREGATISGWQSTGKTGECAIQVVSQMILANVSRTPLLFDHGRGLLPLRLATRTQHACTGEDLRQKTHGKIQVALQTAMRGWHTQHSSSGPSLTQAHMATSLQWAELPSIPLALADFGINAYLAWLAGEVPFPEIDGDDITPFCPILTSASRTSSVRKRRADQSLSSIEVGRCSLATMDVSQSTCTRCGEPL